jgi:hypothetical protein
MRRSDPTRRNRNIGTAKSGHGQDNRMTVAKFAHGANEFWERVENAQQVRRTISGRVVKFFVQPTRAECVHPCTVDDVAQMLAYVPAEDWLGIEAVLLRQPRRKEETLAPVWGRLSYAAELVNKHGAVVYRGPAIVLEGINPTKPFKWEKKLSIEDLAELERLKSEGHEFSAIGKQHTIKPTLESCRATQLYRTLLHEVGHWVDFAEKVERPAAYLGSDGNLDEYCKLLDRFHSRPNREREQFAHSYAQRIRQRLRSIQAIPFDRQLNPERLEGEGLRLQDFVLS